MTLRIRQTPLASLTPAAFNPRRGYLLNSSRRGEIVLDPFAGSGSTLIAAHRTGRKAWLVELDPRWCDVIRQRYEDFVAA